MLGFGPSGFTLHYPAGIFFASPSLTRNFQQLDVVTAEEFWSLITKLGETARIGWRIEI